MKTGSEACTGKSRDIRVLLIEDAPADVELLERELRKGGLEFRARQVDSREAFLHELQHDPPDVILSDHGLPSFDGFTALALTRDRCPEVPFIFVTNSLGEEKAIEAFESGADDCVLKGRLSKLVPAVHRALRKAEERRVWKLVEADRERIVSELHDAVAKAKTPAVEDRSALFSPGQSTMGEGGEGHKHLLPICAHCKKIRDSADAWHTLEIYFRKHFDVEFTHGLCPDCVPLFFPGPLTRK